MSKVGSSPLLINAKSNNAATKAIKTQRSMKCLCCLSLSFPERQLIMSEIKSTLLVIICFWSFPRWTKHGRIQLINDFRRDARWNWLACLKMEFYFCFCEFSVTSFKGKFIRSRSDTAKKSQNAWNLGRIIHQSRMTQPPLEPLGCVFNT